MLLFKIFEKSCGCFGDVERFSVYKGVLSKLFRIIVFVKPFKSLSFSKIPFEICSKTSVILANHWVTYWVKFKSVSTFIQHFIQHSCDILKLDSFSMPIQNVWHKYYVSRMSFTNSKVIRTLKYSNCNNVHMHFISLL